MPRYAFRPLLVVLGLYHLALGGVMLVAPDTFFEEIAAYGPYNDHYIRDVATFYVALGGVMLVAVVRESWRVPVLAFATVQYGLHVLNHLWDIADADPEWMGPANVAALALVGLGLAYLWRVTRRAARGSGG